MANFLCRRFREGYTISSRAADINSTSMMYQEKKIITAFLTCVYLLLALSGPFAFFHRHQMPVQESSNQYGLELHDSSCDKHVSAHVHLSDHCAACQFTSAKQTDSAYVWDLLDCQTSADRLFYCCTVPSSQPHLSLAAGRAPPSSLS